MNRFCLATIAALLPATIGSAAGWQEDLGGKYPTMRGTGEGPRWEQQQAFYDIMSGADTCLPQLLLDPDGKQSIAVTILAPCHTATRVNLLHQGHSSNATISDNGAAFTSLNRAAGSSRVTAVFEDGTVIAAETHTDVRSASLIAAD